MRSLATRRRVELARQLRGRILDCGCGDGLFQPYLRRPGNQVIALDTDEEAMSTVPGTRVVASCAHMPFRDDYFDAVWACAVIEHVPEETLAEMVRVVHPGGRIVAVTPNRHSPFDPLKRICGLKTWKENVGHVRLYDAAELRFYGQVSGETRFLPMLGWFFRRHPELAHVLVVEVQVTEPLKEKIRSRFPGVFGRTPPALARISLPPVEGRLREHPAAGREGPLRGAAQPPPPAVEAARSRWLTALTMLLFVAVLVLVGRALVRQFLSVRWSQMELRWWPAALAVAATVLSRGLGVLAYRRLLAPAPRLPDWPEMMVVAWLPPLGRYLPGKVASLAGAIWLLRRYDVPAALAVSAVFIMNGLMVLLGLMLSLPLTVSPAVLERYPGVWAWSLGMMGCCLVCLHPRVFVTLSNQVLKRLRRPPLGRGDYLLAIAVQVLQWLLMGLGLWLTALAVADLPVGSIPDFISASALSATVGFLAFFAPGGLGVREGILLVVLSPLAGAEAAAIIAVAARLVLTAADVLLGAAGLVLLRIWRRKERPACEG
jgi:hypothetical protein